MELPFDGAISTYFKETAPKDVREAIRRAEKGDIIGNSYPYSDRLNKKAYEKDFEALQIELVRWHHWVRESGQRVAIAWGWGGQLAFIVPEKNLLVVMTTDTQNFETEYAGEKILADHILPALD